MQVPLPFIRQAEALLGREDANCLLAALDEEVPVSIRLNRLKLPPASVVPEPVQLSLLDPVPWCASGYYLDRRPAFTFDPLLHVGCYYVQEASSMFLEQALRQLLPAGVPVSMLDLCAAPGGKSTLACSLLPPGSVLVANEVVRSRSQVLAENLGKWGQAGVVVTNNDPADFASLPACFDVLLADVPCSGEGMFRKDPASADEWSEENVELCRQRQRRIVAGAWPCLKPGGLLIYSTCTYNNKENEGNVRWIRDELGAEVLPLDIPETWKVASSLLPGEMFPVYRFMPHRTRGEGFFMAVLRKQGDGQVRWGRGIPASFQSSGRKRDKKGRKAVPPAFSKEQTAMAGCWLQDKDALHFWVEGNVLCAFPRERASLLGDLRASCRILRAGVPVAEAKGRDVIPCHGLALSNLLRTDAFPVEEVDYSQAIAYLRKETVILPGGISRGFILLSYKGFPLGFVKNVGNRANNLYPQEWRIRSGHCPGRPDTFWHTRP